MPDAFPAAAALPATPPQAQAFPIDAVRAAFPAVTRAEPLVLFDNAAGAQVPKPVFEAVNAHLLERNVQRGGRYAMSQEVDAMVAAARVRVAAFLNATDPDEVCFGMNATSFIRLISLALGQTLAGSPRRRIVLTEIDHEANIAAWLALEAQGAEIVWWRLREDGRLHLEDLAPLLDARTRLVACAAASNALGSVTDLAGVARLAHAVGAELFVDAVHYAPHAVVDVQAWDCDYLVCSGYKIFGPHMGFLWGRRAALEALPTFREDFIPDTPPFKVEAGTFIYENVAGMAAALDYLADLGTRISPGAADPLRAAMEAIAAYERGLSMRMLDALTSVEARVFGVTDPGELDARLPTFGFTLPWAEPARFVEAMATAGFALRDGHMYAPRLIARLGLAFEAGLIRASLCHYNSPDEIDRFAEVLRRMHRG